MTRAQGKRQRVSQPDRAIELLTMRFVSRYGLERVPGRPEELRQPGTDHAVSVQYGAFQVRVRLMEGRTWVRSIDLPLEVRHAVRVSRVLPILDAWFDYCRQCHSRRGQHKADCREWQDLGASEEDATE